MHTIMLWLAFLVLTLGYSTSYTQEAALKIGHPDNMPSSLAGSIHKAGEMEDLGTAIVVYGLITGVYATVWFRKKQ